MNRKYAWCMIVLGTMLLLAALFLVVYNVHTDRESGAVSGEILQVLKQEISEHTSPTEETIYIPPQEDLYDEYETQDTTDPTEATDPVMEVDGRQYAGVLSIPSLHVELPVLYEWSYPNLRLAPCRYYGAAAAGNLVIAAHNYRSHFGNIESLNTGELILFTDVSGRVYTYEVIHTEMINGSDAPAMREGAEEWDLTLFTCTLSGRSRVTVRAVQTEE